MPEETTHGWSACVTTHNSLHVDQHASVTCAATPRVLPCQAACAASMSDKEAKLDLLPDVTHRSNKKEVHDWKDRTHAGRSTHTPDTPHDPPVDFHDQDVYWCETSLQTAEFPCLSEIWMREVNQWVHDGKDRTHAGRSTHTPDTPHDPPVDFHDQDVYWCETSLQTAEFPCLSEIWMREVNQWKLSGLIKSISGSWFQTELQYGRMWVNTMDSACSTVWVVGWVSTDGLISTIQREIMISIDGMIRWNDTGSRTGMISHENLGLVELVNKKATLGRVHEPNRTVLDPGRIILSLFKRI
ncbi:hypothetical protein F2Q70_00002724 [Brassica cretica]|uniref:Uncharacterized protein n=1 Tax=Brassica cretica TaxID=69181 RepID=A0A8S9IKQ4_BRACR|nr:hypothetical protein F2Q70_00002724 [Brassica cretica]